MNGGVLSYTQLKRHAGKCCEGRAVSSGYHKVYKRAVWMMVLPKLPRCNLHQESQISVVLRIRVKSCFSTSKLLEFQLVSHVGLLPSCVLPL